MKFVIAYPEGATPLDPNERDGLKPKHITTQGELNELEQANIIAGLRWLNRLRRPDVLTDAFALQLHKRLFGDVWRWGMKDPESNKDMEKMWRQMMRYLVNDVCVLLNKPGHLAANIKSYYTGFDCPDKFVVGYGMDMAHQFRELPFVGHVVSGPKV